MPEKLETGFFASARYPSVRTGKRGGQKQTPHPVSTVALWNEFGTRNGIPERPFMRNSAADFRNVCHPVLKARLDPKALAVTRQIANELGLVQQTRIQKEITTLNEPPNAPSTIERKGSSSPLVDTGFMRLSVTYNVT